MHQPIILCLLEHCAQGKIGGIHVENILAMVRRCHQHRGRDQSPFELLKRLFTTLSLDESCVLLRQIRQWMSYLGEPFNKIPILGG